MLTKADLTTGLADEMQMTKHDAERAIDWLVNAIEADLSTGGGVILRGFGRLHAATRKAGQGRNVRTGEIIQIPAKQVARFKAGAELVARMNPSV